VAEAPERHAPLNAVALRPQPVALRRLVGAPQPHVGRETELADVLVDLPEGVGVVDPGEVSTYLLAQVSGVRPVPPSLVQEGEALAVQGDEGRLTGRLGERGSAQQYGGC